MSRDKRRGQGQALVLLVGCAYLYFTLWTIIVPLLEEDARKSIDALLFPIDRFYVLAIPTISGVVMASAVLFSLGFVLMKGKPRV